MSYYHLSFYPTILDILYDTHSQRYVQVVAATQSPTTNPDARLTCRDLANGVIVDYKISQFDVIRKDGGLASAVLPNELKPNVANIQESVAITGKIVRRD